MNKKERIKILVDYLNDMTDKYEKGIPEITDEQWDQLFFELQQLEKETGYFLPESPTQKIKDYHVQDKLVKVEHNHKMLSLDKTKDWSAFCDYFQDKPTIMMLKLDGLTLSLTYKNGCLIRAETRGNGIIGEDVTHNAKVIKSIPKKIDYLDDLIVDGEIICLKDDFDKFNSTYSNARNFASGSIRLLDPAECEKRHLTFIVWNVIKGFSEKNTFKEKIDSLRHYGFLTVPYCDSINEANKEILISQAKEKQIPIDGLVGRFNDISYGQSLGETAHHSKAAYAFKFYDDVYPTYLQNIEWSMSRKGQLTPIAVFDPIEIEGAVIQRCSLHNLNTLKDFLGRPFKRQKLNIYRANMIIPQVHDAEKVKESEEKEWIEIPEICPYCGHPLKQEISDSGTILLKCDNNKCDEKFINKLTHFVGKTGLNIKGLSSNTLEKLLDWGWIKDYTDLFRLSEFRSEWIKKSGFGEKSVDKILTAIEESKKCELSAFITALGIRLIGPEAAKTLAKHFETFDDLLKAVQETDLFSFIDIEGFGMEMNNSLKQFDFNEAIQLKNMLNIVNSAKNKTTKVAKLSGENIVITGKLKVFSNRSALKAYIEELGGKVTDSVSKNTTLLITNDRTSNSAKSIAATRLGIPQMTEEEFKNFFDI